jgi:spore maturation protein SpmA
MALSRIWSFFIVVAVLLAFGKFVGSSSNKNIFSHMITGKSGDTVSSKAIAAAELSDSIKKLIEKNKIAPYKNELVSKSTTIDIVAIPLKNNDSTVLDSALKHNITIDNLPKSIKNNLDNNSYTFFNGEKIIQTKNTSYTSFTLQPANGVFETANDAVSLCLKLIGFMALFLGFMSIAEKAGGINLMSRIIGPFFNRIFPEVPKNHPAHGHMVMNFSANLLGLDNAATPFGIKAMESLQEINPNKSTISNPQLMFLCLHASGLTLIPISIIADRVAKGSKYPTDIFIPCMIATFVATLAALSIVSIRQKINLFQPVIIAWLASITLIIWLIVRYVSSLPQADVKFFSGSLSNGIILLIFIAIVLGGLYKKINIFDAFVEGAKQGFETSIRIIPYLVGLLVAISLFRNSGAFDFIINGLKQLFLMLGADTRIVDAIPTSLIKPLSGSGARAMHIDTMMTYGADSFQSNLASVFRGSADTTFYIAAVYLGAVGIKNGRYAISTMFLADLFGIIASIILAYIFFT